MKRKTVVICLAVIGAVCLIASLIIPLISVWCDINALNAGGGIIGGAGAATFEFYFRQAYGGIWSVTTLIGVGMLVAALVVALVKKNP